MKKIRVGKRIAALALSVSLLAMDAGAVFGCEIGTEKIAVEENIDNTEMTEGTEIVEASESTEVPESTELPEDTGSPETSEATETSESTEVSETTEASESTEVPTDTETSESTETSDDSDGLDETEAEEDVMTEQDTTEVATETEEVVAEGIEEMAEVDPYAAVTMGLLDSEEGVLLSKQEEYQIMIDAGYEKVTTLNKNGTYLQIQIFVDGEEVAETAGEQYARIIWNSIFDWDCSLDFTYNQERYQLARVVKNDRTVAKNEVITIGRSLDLDVNTIQFYLSSILNVETATLFDYDWNVINPQSVAVGNENGTFLFHNGGSTNTRWDIFAHAWNLCDGDGTTNSHKAYQGIVQNKLINNQPVFNYGVTDLFDASVLNGKESYTNVSVPFVKEGDYYVFDSDKYAYTYNEEENGLQRSEYNSWESGFWPFGSSNYHFGMNLPLTFRIEEDGTLNGSDTIFEFSGDDDIWVFIDDTLVLDIGGVHGKVKGSINFRDGSVVMSREDGTTNNIVHTKLQNTLGGSYNLYEDALGYESVEGGRSEFSKTDHTLRIFYLERGAGDSNCSIKFNFAEARTMVPTDVSFMKADQNQNALADATFGLYTNEACEGNAAYLATSTEGADGSANVIFEDVVAGTYYLKELVAPTGYVKNTTVFTVEVTNGLKNTQGVLEEGKFVIKNAAGEDVTNGFTFINELEIVEPVTELSKTVVLNDWEARTYDINLSGYSYIELSNSAIEQQTTPADVLFVLDTSVSMDTLVSGSEKSRIDGLVTATKDMVADLPDGSRVAIITFNGSPKKVTENFIELTDDSRDTVNNYVDNLPRGTGTRQDLALEAAEEMVELFTLDKKYVVLVSDGGLHVNSGNYHSRKSLEQAYADAVSSAEAIKNSGITLYSIGLDMSEDSSATSLMKDMASENAYFEATSDEIGVIFESLKADIVVDSKLRTYRTATVRDYIDSRFELTKESITVIEESGGSVVTEGDSVCVVWENVILDNWKAPTFTVKAKNSYAGGNNVTTNGPLSGIYFEDGEISYFEQPTVNVRIAAALGDMEDTIFLGESLDGYYKKENLLNTLVSKYVADEQSNVDWSGVNLGEDFSNVQLIWCEDEACTTEVSAIEELRPQEKTVYYAKAYVNPTEEATEASTANSKGFANGYLEDGRGVEVTSRESKSYAATYTVYVVDGQLNIKKYLEDDYTSYMETEGDAVFTFKIEGELVDGSTVTYYKTLRFAAEDKSMEQQVTLTNLAAGTYTVTEMKTMGYVQTAGEFADKTDCKHEVSDNGLVFTLGKDRDGNTFKVDAGVILEKQAVTGAKAFCEFTNARSRENIPTDTDVVKNSLILGEPIKEDRTVDNGKTLTY